jgi:hypothetical protein
MRQSVLCFLVFATLAATTSIARATPECDRLRPKNSGNDAAWARANAIYRVAGCDAVDFPFGDIPLLWYWLDRPGVRPSELVRTAIVLQCFKKGGHLADALCGWDARHLDAAAFEEEITKNLKLGPEQATLARANFAAAQKIGQDFVKEVKAATPKDTARVLIDVSDQAVADWDKLYQANKALIDNAFTAELEFWRLDPGARFGKVNAIKGCKELRDAWVSSVRAHKAAAPGDMESFVESDPLAFIMLSNLMICDATSGRLSEAWGEWHLVQASRAYRGPRLYQFWAVQEAAAKLAKETNYSVRGGRQSILPEALPVIHEVKRQFPDTEDTDEGPVAAVKSLGNGRSQISFKLIKWNEPTYECVDKKPLHFHHWGQNGQPVWDWTCHVNGSEVKQKQGRAFTVADELLAGSRA